MSGSLRDKLDDAHRHWFEDHGGLEKLEAIAGPFVDQGYELKQNGLLMKDRNLVSPSGFVLAGESTLFDIILMRPTTIHDYHREDEDECVIEEDIHLFVGSGFVYFFNPSIAEHQEGLLVNARRVLRMHETIRLVGADPIAFVPEPKVGYVGLNVGVRGNPENLGEMETVYTDWDRWNPHSGLFKEE